MEPGSSSPIMLSDLGTLDSNNNKEPARITVIPFNSTEYYTIIYSVTFALYAILLLLCVFLFSYTRIRSLWRRHINRKKRNLLHELYCESEDEDFLIAAAAAQQQQQQKQQQYYQWQQQQQQEQEQQEDEFTPPSTPTTPLITSTAFGVDGNESEVSVTPPPSPLLISQRCNHYGSNSSSPSSRLRGGGGGGFTRPRQDSNFSGSRLNESPSPSSTYGGFENNNTKDRRYFWDSHRVFHSFILLATLGRCVYVGVCIFIPYWRPHCLRSSILDSAANHNAMFTMLAIDGVSLIYYHAYLSLVFFWAYVFICAKFVKAVEKKAPTATNSGDKRGVHSSGYDTNDEDSNSTDKSLLLLPNDEEQHNLRQMQKRRIIKLKILFEAIVVASFVILLGVNLISWYLQRPSIYVIGIMAVFYPILAMVTSIGFIFFGIRLYWELKRSAEVMHQQYYKATRTQLKKIGLLASIGTLCFFVRALVVIVVNLKFPTITNWNYFDSALLLFWIVLEWLPSIFIMIGLNVFNGFDGGSGANKQQHKVIRVGSQVAIVDAKVKRPMRIFSQQQQQQQPSLASLDLQKQPPYQPQQRFEQQITSPDADAASAATTPTPTPPAAAAAAATLPPTTTTTTVPTGGSRGGSSVASGSGSGSASVSGCGSGDDDAISTVSRSSSNTIATAITNASGGETNNNNNNKKRNSLVTSPQQQQQQPTQPAALVVAAAAVTSMRIPRARTHSIYIQPGDDQDDDDDDDDYGAHDLLDIGFRTTGGGSGFRSNLI